MKKKYTPPVITLFDHPALGWKANEQTTAVGQAVFDNGGLRHMLQSGGGRVSYSDIKDKADQNGVGVIRALADKGFFIVKIDKMTEYRKHYPKAKVIRAKGDVR